MEQRGGLFWPHPSQPSQGIWGKRTQRTALASPHIPAGLCTACLSAQRGHQCVAHHCTTQPVLLQHGDSWLCLAMGTVHLPIAFCCPAQDFLLAGELQHVLCHLSHSLKGVRASLGLLHPTAFTCPSLLHPVLGVHPFHCPRGAAESPRLVPAGRKLWVCWSYVEPLLPQEQHKNCRKM